MSTANEILLQIAETQRRLQPVHDALERELLQALVRRVCVMLWWRQHLKPSNPRLLLTYEH